MENWSKFTKSWQVFSGQSGFRDRGCRHGGCSLNPDYAVVENMKTKVKYTLGQSKNKKLFYSTTLKKIVYVRNVGTEKTFVKRHQHLRPKH